MLSDFMKQLLEKVRVEYPQAILLDGEPAVYESLDTPYIAAPEEGEVEITHLISSHSKLDFTIHIYVGDHAKDCNRQTNVSGDLLKAMRKAEEIYKTCFPRFREDGKSGLTIVFIDPTTGNKIAAVNDTTTYSTQTWVVTGRVFARAAINMHFQAYVDY